MSDDDLPADPWAHGGGFSAMLDNARQLRMTLSDLESASAVFAAVEALSEDELRMIAIELGLDALWSRRGESV